MVDAAGDHDARVRFASFPNAAFPLPALAAGRVLARDQDADVLLLDSIAAAFLAPWLLVHRLDRPLVAIAHQPPGGIDHGRLRTRAQAVLDVVAYRRARRLLVASDALAEDFVAAGLDGDRVQVIAPGRDVAAPANAPVEDLREGRAAAVLSVGNWVPRKGLLALLDAFARLPRETATLHLAGDDTADPAYGARVRRRLSRPDLAGRVRVHGPVAAERVAVLYRDADVFALASTHEPYGTVYGEAMAAGLPVIGWRAGNLPHMVDDGREGLVVAPGDVDALARGLQRLVADAGYRRTLGAAALHRSEAFPTWEQTAARLFAQLHEVAAGGGR